MVFLGSVMCLIFSVVACLRDIGMSVWALKVDVDRARKAGSAALSRKRKAKSGKRKAKREVEKVKPPGGSPAGTGGTPVPPGERNVGDTRDESRRGMR